MNYDIQAYIKTDDTDTDAVNTKTLWPNAWLLKSENTLAYGKPKNIVTESFPEADGLKVWTPQSVTHDATDVKLTLCFIGDSADMHDEFDSFMAYIEGKVIEWWDTVRFRKNRLLLTDKVEPSENYHGQIPYLEVEFKFKNVDGKASDQRGYWQYEWSDQFCVKVEGANNGWARRKTLTFTREDDEDKTFAITAAFGSYPLINDTTFASMGDAEYAQRLNAFESYALGWMASHYDDFAGMVTGVVNGASVFDPVTCTIQ